MLFRQAIRFNKLAKTNLARASWDTTELTIPADEKPILSLKYDKKYISVLGFHNSITPDNDIVSNIMSD